MKEGAENTLHFAGMGFLVLALVVISISTSQGQDFSKVIAVVQKLETDLNALIANERKAREAETRELRSQMQALMAGRNPGVAADLAVKHSADPLARLMEGNERFVGSVPSAKSYATDRSANVGSQHPYAIILSCADSRVPPELIFDESLGQLFVVRDAGNLVDSVILGSIEYAAEHLKVPLLIVLGHESCGAIKATLAGGEVPPNIGSLVRRLVAPVERAKAKKPQESELVSTCVAENVRYQMAQMLVQSGVLTELVEKGELALRGAVYDLESGKVDFLEVPLHPQSGHESSSEKKEHDGH